jgi:hypothetical protein
MSNTNQFFNGAIIMKLGGRTRNMFTEPFEETEPEYALYGEFKRQIGHAINTKTESNIFRPEPHNKEIGKTKTEKEITQRVERIDDQGYPDNNQDPASNEDFKNYQNMFRAQAKQAHADTNACELYISTLGTYRKAQIQSIIDDNIISPRMRLDKIMTTHWNEVKTKIPTIIANFKQQWEIYQVRSNDLTTIMTNLNILQEINKQVNNFDPKEIYTGLQMIQKLMPTLVAREFNAMSGEWQNSIDRNRATTITQVAEDIQKCFNLNSKVTDLSTYGFIAHNAQAHHPRINSARTYDTYRDRNQQGRHEQHRAHTEADRQERTPRSFGERQRSREPSSPMERSNPRSPDHTRKYTQSPNRDREMSQTRGRSSSRDIRQRPRIEETASKPTKAYTERQRSRSRDPSVPRETPFKRRSETTPRPTRTQSNA